MSIVLINDKYDKPFILCIECHNTNKEAKKEAEDQLSSLESISEKEMAAEALIKAQGFDDALVFIDQDSANVIELETLKLTRLTRLRILSAKNLGFRLQM